MSTYIVWVNNTTWRVDATDMQAAWEDTKREIEAPHWSDKRFTAHVDIYLGGDTGDKI